MYDCIGAALYDHAKESHAKLEECLAFYQSAVAVGSLVERTSVARVQNNAGVVLQRLGRFDEASKHYSEALKSQNYASSNFHLIASSNLDRLQESLLINNSGVMDRTHFRVVKFQSAIGLSFADVAAAADKALAGEVLAAIAENELLLTTKEHASAEDKPLPKKKKLVLMVSAPENGPDGSGGFSFPMMKSILELSQTAENMVVAYDWAGSGNAFSDDTQKWDMIFGEPTSGKRHESILADNTGPNHTLYKKWYAAPNDLAKAKVLNEIESLVKDTKWFAAYCGAVKHAIRLYCQNGAEVLLVCIEGGPVTRVEAAEMPRLREEAMSDLQKVGFQSPSIEICSVATFQEFEQLVENESLFVTSKEQASVEDKALADEILALLENAQNAKLTEGRHHTKAGNLHEALGCFSQVIGAPTSVSPQDLDKAKVLRVYTLYKIGIRCLQDQAFDEAATQFGKALQHRPDSTSVERVQKLQLFHACSLYEAGKRHCLNGDLGEARKRFESAKKTEALPDELEKKTLDHIEECKQRSKELRKIDAIEVEEVDESATVKIGGNEAFELYKQAKRLMARGDANQARQQFEDLKQHEDVPKELKKRTRAYIKALRNYEYKGEEATTCIFSDNSTHVLGSSAVTLELSTDEIRWLTPTLTLTSANTMPIQRHASRELVMVLDEKFPVDSKARGDLITLLRTDVSKALAAIQIDNITRG
jgi:tetratricopeptide (TPR) repeat protein